MRYCCYVVLTFMLTFLLAVPSRSQGAKGSGSAPKGSGSAPAKGSGLAPGGSSPAHERFLDARTVYSGKLASWDKDTRTLVMDVEIKVPDFAVVKEITNIKYQMTQASRESNPVTRAQRIADLSNQLAQKQAVEFKSLWQKVEMKVKEDAMVRMAVLPPRFDDKGVEVKPTKEELRKLQDPRNPKLFKAELGDIRTGVYAEVKMVVKAGSKTRLPTLPQQSKPGLDPNAEKPLITLDDSYAVSYVVLGADVNQVK